MDNFWDRVSNELEYKGLSNKELAIAVGIDPSNISKGLKNKNSPSVETAVKIAQVLGVTVEFLVTGKNPSSDPNDSSYDVSKFHKYSKTIEALDRMNEQTRKPIISMINDLTPDYSK